MDEKLRLMIVDDNPHARKALSAFISTQDWLKVISEASNGDDAVKKIRDQSSGYGSDGYSNASHGWAESNTDHKRALAPDQGHCSYDIRRLSITGKTGGCRCIFGQGLFHGRNDIHNTLFVFELGRGNLGGFSSGFYTFCVVISTIGLIKR